MLASPGDFIDVVVCDLYDGTPPTNDTDPASHVRWVCPKFRIVGSESVTRVLDVRRLGPKSDLDHQLGLALDIAERLASKPSR